MKRIIPILILLAGCAATRTPTGQEDIEALNKIIAGYMLEVPVAAPFTVPGGMVALQAPCADFDSGTVKSVGGRLQVKCPDHQVNADSLVRANPVFKLALAARALADAKVNLQEWEIVKLETEASKLKEDLRTARKRLTWFYIAAGLLAAGMIASLVYKFKTGGFGLLKFWK